MERPNTKRDRLRSRLVQILQLGEDLIYATIGLALLVAAVTLLGSAMTAFLGSLRQDLHTGTIQMLDALLLILMLVEILHTVGISLREHVLVVEPFLIVGLIAVIRRVLVITAEQSRFISTDPAVFERLMLELGLLAFIILVLGFSIYLIRKQEKPV